MRLTPLAYATMVVTSATSAFALTPLITAAVARVMVLPEDNLFDFKTLQLTSELLNQLDLRSRALYQFGDALRALPENNTLPPVRKCKVFLGDLNWPN
jgi:hypothetical protein